MSTKVKNMNSNVDFGDILAFGAVAIIAFWLFNDSCGKEGFTGSPITPMLSMVGATESPDVVDKTPSVPMPTAGPTNNAKKSSGTNGTTASSGEVSAYEEAPLAPLNYTNDIAKNIGTGCNDLKFVSTNLLPKGDAQLDDTFEEFSPANLEGQNFLDSKNFQIGMQSQVLRNANLQLRSEPTNPQESVCAWNQSTIGPEIRRNLDIGSMANKLAKTVDGVM